jgi:hypothetical protein
VADHYKSGQPIQRQASFRVGGALTDPTTVTAKVRKPDGSTQTYVYGTHPELTRSSLGVFVLKLTDTVLVGRWSERFIGTGNAEGVQEGEFYVDASDFDAVSELEANGLTTVDRAEVFLDRVGIQIGEDEEADDRVFLTMLINGFSGAIARYTSREFKPQTAAAARTFAYDGNGFLSLAPYEARTVSSVVVFAGEPGERALGASEWRGRPRQKSLVCQTYLWLALPVFELPNYSLTSYPSSRDMDVRVTGDWGAAAVPAEVELACLVAVANAYQRQEDFKPRVLDEIEISEVDAGGVAGEDNRYALPRSARRLLDPFKRVSL